MRERAQIRSIATLAAILLVEGPDTSVMSWLQNINAASCDTEHVPSQRHKGERKVTFQKNG